jgi:hypothetical protein
MKLVPIILIALTAAAMGCGGPEVTGTAEQKDMIAAVQKAGGDVNKLDPEMRKRVEDAAKSDPMSSTRRPGGPGAMGASGMPLNYPTPAGR